MNLRTPEDLLSSSREGIGPPSVFWRRSSEKGTWGLTVAFLFLVAASKVPEKGISTDAGGRIVVFSPLYH